MSENPPAVENAAKAAPKAPPIQNPALRMLGLPRIRARLPGRNWLIFWGILVTFSGTVYYDRRQKKIIQQKWCNAVSHLSQEPLAVDSLPRRITVFLAAPPGDSLRPVREHFQEYIKPILLASGVDWEAVEGRKEGDVRAALAERIRKRRRKAANEALDEDENVVEEWRRGIGVQIKDEMGGDIVLGRHTLKEYLRGLHEGWLGPTKRPEVAEEPEKEEPAKEHRAGELSAVPDSTEDQASPTAAKSQAEAESTEEKKPSKPSPTPPYIRPSEYSQSADSGLPSEFPVSSIIANPHLLGFLNTPRRVYRYLNKRALAEEQGRAVVDLLLTTAPVAYDRSDEWEQKTALLAEEKDFHKSATQPNPAGEEDKERPWTEEVVIDDRVGSRMRKPDHVLYDDSIPGHLLDWRGAADPVERVSWPDWLRWAFDIPPKPKYKGWEDGLKDGS